MDAPFPMPAEPAPTAGTVPLECHALVRTYAHLRVREPGAEARLVASLAEVGQQSPVLAVRDADRRAVLIDGYRRVRALERLGRDTVDAIVLGLSEADALIYCHRQETSRRRSVLEDGWLLRELRGQGPTLRALGEALHRSTSWISRRLGLVQALPESVEEAVRRGVVPPHSAMKSLVPLARANKGHCEELVRRLGAERITTRQMAQLYAAWRAGNDEQKERVVTAPLLSLRAAQGVTPAEPRDELGWLVRALGATGEACVRVQMRLERAARVDPRAAQAARVQRAWSSLVTAWEGLHAQMEEPDEGP
jgi:ParB/RepB/Spo0J family partition protein